MHDHPIASGPVELRFIDLFLLTIAALVVVALAVLLQRAATDDPPRIHTRSLPTAALGERYDIALAASGGSEPLRWRLSAGRLPSGMRLASDGRLHGVMRWAGSQTFGVTLRDAGGRSTDRMLKLTAASAPPRVPVRRDRPRLELATVLLPRGRSDVQYQTRLRVDGGQGGIAWHVSAGELPPGLTLSPAGVLAGVPDVGPLSPRAARFSPRARARARRRAGTYRFTVVATTGSSTATGTAVVYVEPDKGSLGLRLLTGETNGLVESIASVVTRLVFVLGVLALAFFAAIPLWMLLVGHESLAIRGWRGRVNRREQAS